MNDLIERVAKAVRPTMWDSNEAARAAIKEVADWLDEQPLETGHETYDMATARLYKALGDKTGDAGK